MCFPSDTRYSHRPMREVRMPLYEVFASPYARGSHASIRSVCIALCERFACFYTKCSHRLMRDMRSARIEMSVTVGISILSNVGETVYPMPDKPIIQVERRAVKRLCLLKPVLRLHLSELLVFDRAFHNFFVDFLFAVFFNKSRIF